MSLFRVPRRSEAAWERVRDRLADQLRESGIDDPKPADVYASAVALLEVVLWCGPGVVAEAGHAYEAPPRFARPPFEAVLGPCDPRRKTADRIGLAAQLREIAKKLEEAGDGAE